VALCCFLTAGSLSEPLQWPSTYAIRQAIQTGRETHDAHASMTKQGRGQWLHLGLPKEYAALCSAAYRILHVKMQVLQTHP